VITGGRHRFARGELLLQPSLKARLEGRAQVEGRSLGELARDLLSAAIEAREAGPDAIARSRADRLVELAEEKLNELRTLSMLVGAVGRTVLGNQQLLVHWATREDDFGISDEVLSAELQAAGAEGWQQILAELRASADEPPSRRAGEE
jgi:plasmid stability protein